MEFCAKLHTFAQNHTNMCNFPQNFTPDCYSDPKSTCVESLHQDEFVIHLFLNAKVVKGAWSAQKIQHGGNYFGKGNRLDQMGVDKADEGDSPPLPI